MATMTVQSPASHTAWSPTIIVREALRFREARLVLTSRILRKDKDTLKKGQILEIPEVLELDAQTVGADRTVTPQAETGTVKTLTINQFKASPFEVGVDMDEESVIDGKAAYGPAAGYAIAKAVEDYIWTVADTATITQTDNVTGALQDADLRTLAQYLEDAEAMFAGDCYIAMAPHDKNDIIGIDKFAQVMFTGLAKGANVTGKAPDIYGLVPLVTTRAGTDSNSKRRVLAFQKEAFALAIQKTVMLASEKKLLKTLYAAWNLYGATITRANHAAFARVA